jgi:AraC-like DNA-binding protein
VVLEELGIAAPPQLRCADTRLSIEAYFVLWEAIAAASDDQALGLRLGASYPEHVLEPAFLACLGSRTLGEALDRLVRYKCTLCPERVALERRARHVELRYSWPTAHRAPPAILIDAELSFLLHLARRATRRPLHDAHLTLVRSSRDRARLSQIVRAEVRVGGKVAALRLPAEVLELPCATFNPSLLAALDPALEAERPRGARVRDEPVASVRQVLQRRLGDGDVPIQLVAEELGLSARTLQRQLGEAGTSFATLEQETRQERAVFYLKKSELSLSEIAYLLGFQTPTSFNRAFARWTGRTPGAFRSS